MDNNNRECYCVALNVVGNKNSKIDACLDDYYSTSVTTFPYPCAHTLSHPHRDRCKHSTIGVVTWTHARHHSAIRDKQKAMSSAHCNAGANAD